MVDNECSILQRLDPIIQDYFLKELGHNQLTIVQKCTIEKMLNNFDCVVQSPTGSGKTLAYILPLLEILNKNKEKIDSNNASCKIISLIIAPSRELINQIFQLFKPICKKLNLRPIRMFGSSGAQKKKMKIDLNYFKGKCIVITTPGRFDSYINQYNQLKNYLKFLEVLIIDEADKFKDQDTRKSICSILSILPKQRRSALFSATEMSNTLESKINELARFGLRNPLKIIIGSDNKIKIDNTIKQEITIKNEVKMEQDDQEESNITPKELINYYACVPAEYKFLAMIKFLKSQQNEKILVFVSNTAQCEYFGSIVPKLLEDDNDRLIIEMHRKMEGKRQKVLDQFRNTKRSILFSTDIMARGIDVLDIDWVLQYDFPKLSKLFVHRSGRAGRMGRKGQSLLLLTIEESAYIQFLEKHENVVLEESEFGILSSNKATKIKEKIQQMAIEDRKILELGSAAFVSFIESYNRHDTQIVCKVKDLDIIGLANSFALLRLPKIRELNGRKDLIEKFKPRLDIKIHDLKYKDEKLEKRRLQMEEKNKKKNAKHERRKLSRKMGDSSNDKQKGFGKMIKGKDMKIEQLNIDLDDEPNIDDDHLQQHKQQQNGGSGGVKNLNKKRKKQPEWEQLQKSEKLLKKFKKGKITKEELNEEIDELN